MQLDGKTCLVTGGTKGIGAAAAMAFAERGANLALVARHTDDEALATKRRIEALGRTDKPVIQFADLRGDSYKLAKSAAESQNCRWIVFCGVHFMAETADILTRPSPRRLTRS